MRVLAFIVVLLAGLASGCGTGSSSLAPGPGPTRARTGEASAFANQTVTLRPGWNAVGLKGLPVTAVNGSAEVIGFVSFDGTAYQQGSLTPADLNKGSGTSRGLWIYSNGNGSLAYSAVDIGGTTVNLVQGWNLVAFPASQLLAGSGLQTRNSLTGNLAPLSSLLLPQFVQINADSTYTSIDVSAGGNLTPGRAYWIFSLGPVNLSWGTVVSPTPSPGPSPSATASPSPGGSPSPGSSPTVSPSPTTSPTPQGQGAPPNGKYTVGKISGSSYIILGTLEISGLTYRGLEDSGAFSSFSLNAAGNMVLSSGLVGLPAGYTITSVRYRGIISGDHLIEIFYRTSGGTLDEMEALLKP